MEVKRCPLDLSYLYQYKFASHFSFHFSIFLVFVHLHS